MESVINTNEEENYWTTRYIDHSTGWDIGYPSTPLKEYIDQLTNKEIKILIPGAGNAYEAEYLLARGFNNVYVLDISALPLQSFAKRNPNFPKQNLIETNFFEHQDEYDLILEQTFFCSFEPSTSNRNLYAKHCAELLNKNGKLVGLWFNIPLIKGNIDERPFGGSKGEYENYLNPYFQTRIFEPCYNSIQPRAGQELFGIFIKK